MDEKEKELLETMEQEQADVELPKARIAYVMAIVAICAAETGLALWRRGCCGKNAESGRCCRPGCGLYRGGIAYRDSGGAGAQAPCEKNLEQEDEG